MADEYFKGSAYELALRSALGFGPALVMAAFGDSHINAMFTSVLQQALAIHHDANIYYDFRPVYSGTGDGATTVNNPRGYNYAVGASTPDHLVNTQLVQFQADVAAGFR